MRIRLRTFLAVILLSTILLSIIISVTIIISIPIVSVPVTHTGAVTAVNISVTPTSLDWGVVESGTTKTLPLQVSNTGNIPLTLDMNTDGLPTYLGIAWDKEGVVLAEGATTTATLALTVSPTAPAGATFAFGTIIVGEG